MKNLLFKKKEKESETNFLNRYIFVEREEDNFLFFFKRVYIYIFFVIFIPSWIHQMFPYTRIDHSLFYLFYFFRLQYKICSFLFLPEQISTLVKMFALSFFLSFFTVSFLIFLLLSFSSSFNMKLRRHACTDTTSIVINIYLHT